MKRLRAWAAVWWMPVDMAIVALVLFLLGWQLDSDAWAAVGVAFLGASITRLFDIQREREARAISDREIARLTAEGRAERARLAAEARRRDLDETRRLFYMLYLKKEPADFPGELVATIINAVVHHSRVMPGTEFAQTIYDYWLGDAQAGERMNEVLGLIEDQLVEVEEQLREGS